MKTFFLTSLLKRNNTLGTVKISVNNKISGLKVGASETKWSISWDKVNQLFCAFQIKIGELIKTEIKAYK